jgi:hypothetical protein
MAAEAGQPFAALGISHVSDDGLDRQSTDLPW